MRTLLIIVLVLVGIVLARWSFFTVDAGEYVYATVFGRPVATYDGSDAEQAGLRLGWPWPIAGLQRLDRRTQVFDLPTAELLTHDPQSKTTDKTLSVDAFVLWKITDRDAVDRFIKRLGSAERARAILAPRINSQLGAAIGNMRMDDLVSTDAGPGGGTRVDETIRVLRAGLLDKLQKEMREEYGIDLIDIRLRRFSHPAEVRASIFERIKSERLKRVNSYQSEGDRRAQNIASKADQHTRQLLAEAKFEEEKIKSKADTDSLKIRNAAQSQDPEFYDFLKRMESLQSVLSDTRSTLLLSTHRSIFDLLFNPPRPKAPDKIPEKKQ
jgi:membrane protease subunit HflC